MGLHVGIGYLLLPSCELTLRQGKVFIQPNPTSGNVNCAKSLKEQVYAARDPERFNSFIENRIYLKFNATLDI